MVVRRRTFFVDAAGGCGAHTTSVRVQGNVLALLAQQPALAVAVVEGNGMTGTVEGLVRATAARNAPSRLYQLWAKDNALTGAIPEGLTRLGVWRMPRRTFRNRIVPHVLDLENNSLRGAVPDVLYESQSPNIVVRAPWAKASLYIISPARLSGARARSQSKRCVRRCRWTLAATRA